MSQTVGQSYGILSIYEWIEYEQNDDTDQSILNFTKLSFFEKRFKQMSF